MKYRFGDYCFKGVERVVVSEGDDPLPGWWTVQFYARTGQEAVLCHSSSPVPLRCSSFRYRFPAGLIFIANEVKL
jgi:hypothetical protein